MGHSSVHSFSSFVGCLVMVLSPVERTPLIAIRFAPKVDDRLIALIIERFRDTGMILLGRTRLDDGRTLLRWSTTQDSLEEMAERIHYMKMTRDNTVEYFRVQDRHLFCREEPLETDFDENLDAHGIFSAHEWTLLIRRILDSITVLRGDETSSELSNLLDSQYHAHYTYHVDILDSKTEDMRLASTRIVREHGERSACLRHVLEAYGIVDAVIIPHIPKLRESILKNTWWPWYRLTPPVDEIQKYYGWEISFYFSWMGFLTRWLMFPGITGLFVYAFRLYRHDKIDNDEFTPFYGLLTFIWGVLFLRFWERNEDRLAYRWGVYSLSPYERAKYFAVRPQFQGFLRKSPVTGRLETYYPPIRRRVKYIVSALVTIAMLCVAFTVMICSLNLQGFIDPKRNPKRWNRMNIHPFHIRSLSEYSGDGQMFDAKSTWKSILPVLIHVLCMFTMNNTYRVIAEVLTSWENHETTVQHRSSLILKRFLFEAFDCYVALFYLAFYERDVQRLRMELVAVFQIDTFRRIFLECIVPMLIQRFLYKKAVGRGLSKSYSTLKTMYPTEETILEDLAKDDYEQFDDYMEIVIQLGYVTLFASALPLGSLMSIAAYAVESLPDCFKLTYLCRRPPSYRAAGLGMWRLLMSCVIWTSALTNCLIVGFTSGQLMYYMPDFYIRDSRGVNNFGHEDGWLAVLVIFGLERVLLILGLIIYAVVPPVPEDVANELERRQYLRMERIKDSFTSSFASMGFGQDILGVLDLQDTKKDK